MTHYRGRLPMRREPAWSTVTLPGRPAPWSPALPMRLRYRRVARGMAWHPAARAWRVRLRIHGAAA